MGASRSRLSRATHTREAILAAAETAFADHGFAGARVDAIAEACGYNKTLIFRYFGDKLGLYAAVLKRIDTQALALQADLLGPLFAEANLVLDAERFRAYLTAAIGAFFDYMVAHPQVMRLLIWEQAEGWRTYAKIATLFQFDGLQQVERLFTMAQRAGLLRGTGDTLVLLLLAEQICWSFSTALPFYQLVLPHRDFSSPKTHIQVREQVIAFIVAGLLVDYPDGQERKS